MPFGDRTGPAGLGPRTGRGAGFCGGFGVPGSENRAGGFGFVGRGRRGWRNWFHATGLTGWQRASGSPWGPQGVSGPQYAASNREEELGASKNQAGYFESVLEAIRKRLDALETKAKPE